MLAITLPGCLLMIKDSCVQSIPRLVFSIWLRVTVVDGDGSTDFAREI